MKRRKKSNGRRAVNDRKSTIKARGRVLRKALKQGEISNEEARQVMGLHQVWYHLNKLAEAGVLKRTGHNAWEPVRQRGRPRHV
jgi:predicted ArsR family transcriptional regulator